MLLSKYAVCNSRKSKFIKEQEARGLSSSLGILDFRVAWPLCFPAEILGRWCKMDSGP